MHHITDRLKQVIIFITNFKQRFVRLHVSFIIIATHVNFCNIFFSPPKNKPRIEKLKLIRAQVFSFSGLSQKICKNTEIPIFVPSNEEKSNTCHLGTDKKGRILPRVLRIDVQTLRDNAEKYDLFEQ